MSVIMSRQIVVPKYVTGTPASDLAEGGIVYFNENGTPVPFYIAKHDYESGLNGAGRTLFVRKDACGLMAWNSINRNSYDGSTIDNWFNNTYKALLDAAVQNAIGTTKFYYTPGIGTNTVTTLERAVFALSLTELGKSMSNANVEGSALPIASMLQIAYRDGTAVAQWTRTPETSDVFYACLLKADGSVTRYSSSYTYEPEGRPAFTLPSTAKFDPETNVFLGVA